MGKAEGGVEVEGRAEVVFGTQTSVFGRGGGRGVGG